MLKRLSSVASASSKWLQVSHVLALTRASCVTGTVVYHFGYAERPNSSKSSRVCDILSICLKPDPRFGSASTSPWVGIYLLKRPGEAVILCSFLGTSA